MGTRLACLTVAANDIGKLANKAPKYKEHESPVGFEPKAQPVLKPGPTAFFLR